MASLLSHWVGLWIVSGKMVTEFNCFQYACFIFWLAFLVITIHPSCYRVIKYRNLTQLSYFETFHLMLKCSKVLV